MSSATTADLHHDAADDPVAPPLLARPALQASLAATLIPATFALIAASHWAGVAWYDNPKEFFEENRPATWASVATLWLTAFLCFAAARGDPRRRARQFWVASGIAFFIAGADDGFRIHEGLDKLFTWLFDLPRNKGGGLDDWIVLAWAVPVLVTAWRARRELWAMPRVLGPWAVAAGLFAAMVWADMQNAAPWLEEGLKAVAGATFAVGAAGGSGPASDA